MEYNLQDKMYSHSEGLSQQTIKPRGTLQNMLNQSFSDRACCSENIDDSLGAGADRIRIHFDTKKQTIIHSDNGKGMSKEKCFEAHCLNTRKDRSKEQQGRFGIGRKQAQAVMTNLESTSKTLTKARATSDHEDPGEGVIELDIPWKECIEKDMYVLNPHDISAKSLSLWNTYAIDPKQTGTVTVIPCCKKIFESLVNQIQTKILQDNLIFHFGRTYYKYLEQGSNISFFLDGKELPVRAVNPLLPTYPEKDAKSITRFAVFIHPKSEQIRVYYKDNDADVYRDFTNSTVGTKVVSSDLKEWKFLGRIDLTCIYLLSDKLMSSYALDPSKYTLPTEENQSGIQALRSFLGGTYYIRNGKIITRSNIPRPNAGDTAHYKFYQDLVQAIEFDSDLDDHFDIQVNKSKIDESNITQEIRYTLKFIMNEFSRKMIAKYCRCEKCLKTKEPVQTAAPVATPVPPPIQVKTIPATKTETSSVIDHLKKTPAVATPLPTPARTQAPLPLPVPSSTHTVVEAHTREQSKSARDVLDLAMSFAERLLNSDNIDDVYKRSNNQAQKGYVKYWNTLHELEDLLRDFGVHLEDA